MVLFTNSIEAIYLSSNKQLPRRYKMAKSLTATKVATTAKAQAKAKAKTKSKAATYNWTAGLNAVEAQESNHTYKSELLSAETIGQIKTNMDKVVSLIKSGTEHDKEIATHLFKISVQLKDTAVKKYGDNKKAVSKKTKAAIRELALMDFNLRPSRAFEYIRLANYKSVFEMKLPISHLIELSRLKNEGDLNGLLKVKPEKELEQLKYRQVQALVKLFNSSKRKEKSPKAILKLSEFEMFVENIEEVKNSFSEKSLNEFTIKKIEDFASWAIRAINAYHNKKAA